MFCIKLVVPLCCKCCTDFGCCVMNCDVLCPLVGFCCCKLMGFINLKSGSSAFYSKKSSAPLTEASTCSNKAHMNSSYTTLHIREVELAQTHGVPAVRASGATVHCSASNGQTNRNYRRAACPATRMMLFLPARRPANSPNAKGALSWCGVDDRKLCY
jgi:hypothetical protein